MDGLYFKETPLRSGSGYILTKTILENLFFLLSTCVGHSSLSCGTFICILSVGKSFKTCTISVDIGKAFERISLCNRYILNLNRVAKSIEDILRYNKISFMKLNTLVTRKYRFSKVFFFKCVTRPKLGVPLNVNNVHV